VVASAPGELAKPDLQKAAGGSSFGRAGACPLLGERKLTVPDALEQIDAYLTIVRTLKPVPESCFPTCPAIYSVLDALLARYAKLYYIAERVGSVLRRGLVFFPHRALEPVVQPVLERMVLAFEQTGYASYLWITGKLAAKFGEAARGPGGEALAGLLARSFEGITMALGKQLQTKVAIEIPDGESMTAPLARTVRKRD
jgi:transportin-3